MLVGRLVVYSLLHQRQQNEEDGRAKKCISLQTRCVFLPLRHIHSCALAYSNFTHTPHSNQILFKEGKEERKNGEIKSGNSFRTSGRPFRFSCYYRFQDKKKKVSQVKIYSWFYDCYYCFRHLRYKDFSCVFRCPYTHYKHIYTNTNT